MWDLIVSVHDHFLSFYFTYTNAEVSLDSNKCYGYFLRVKCFNLHNDQINDILPTRIILSEF